MIDTVALSHELDDINIKIKELTLRKKQIRDAFKRHSVAPVGTTEYWMKDIWLYALKLEDGKYYIGMTRNVDKRFLRHQRGKGAKWTKSYKPIEIVERRNTQIIREGDASILEDEMTIDYARRYGFENVRGGQYCMMKQKFPIHITEPELEWINII